MLVPPCPLNAKISSGKSRPGSKANEAAKGPSRLNRKCGSARFEWLCPHCGRMASPDAVFCSFCGFDLRTTALQPKQMANAAKPGDGTVTLEKPAGVVLAELDADLGVGRTIGGKEFDVNPSVLTKHTIVLGATGSGKTVLCKAIIEEATLRGIPVLAIDPKGDISCLAISSKDYQFRPWSDVEADALRKPQEEYAGELQRLYSEKAKENGITEEKLTSFIENTEVRIFTPKSSAGIPVSISPKLDAPPQFSRWVEEEPSTVSDLLDISVTSLLNIVRPGRGAEDQQAVSYLSSILENQWQQGNEVDLTSLIGLVQNPPFKKVGNLPLDQIFPRKERNRLAADLNLFNVHPRLRAWMHGAPLDFDRLFQTGPKTPVNVIDLRGIQSQDEKFFFVEMLLQQLYTWVMKQQGVQNLRFILYFDEVVGFCPPVREPPSKKSLLLLIKQARAFGLGIILATQNPIDLDYKVISNANVRFIGRLATERDIERVKVGLDLPSEAAETIETLEKGQFFCQIFDPRSSGVITPRWLMTYHRGPLQDEEISALMAKYKNELTTPENVEPTPPALTSEESPPPMPTPSSEEAEAVAAEPPTGSSTAVQSAAPTAQAGIQFVIRQEEVPSYVKREKTHALFGQEEVIGDVRPTFRWMLELGVGVRTGLLSKRYQTKYLLLDGITGAFAELGRGLSVSEGLGRLIGLDSKQVEVLRNVKTDKFSSAIDVAAELNDSADYVRQILRALESKRLVRSSQMGRTMVYRRTVDIPNLVWHDSAVPLAEVEQSEGSQPLVVTEDKAREIVKGLRGDMDIASYRPFLYPLYRVNLTLGGKSRTVWVDGVTGSQLKP